MGTRALDLWEAALGRKVGVDMMDGNEASIVIVKVGKETNQATLLEDIRSQRGLVVRDISESRFPVVLSGDARPASGYPHEGLRGHHGVAARA